MFSLVLHWRLHPWIRKVSFGLPNPAPTPPTSWCSPLGPAFAASPATMQRATGTGCPGVHRCAAANPRACTRATRALTRRRARSLLGAPFGASPGGAPHRTGESRARTPRRRPLTTCTTPSSWADPPAPASPASAPASPWRLSRTQLRAGATDNCNFLIQIESHQTKTARTVNPSINQHLSLSLLTPTRTYGAPPTNLQGGARGSGCLARGRPHGPREPRPGADGEAQ